MSKVSVQIGWNDVPHLTAEAKADLLKSYPVYQRDARSKGIPQLGSGAIYQIAESDITIDPVEIKPFWRRAYGLDVGWNRTAAIWGAYDQDADVLYLTHEYERSMTEPATHAAAINLRGRWIPGVIDPASRGRQQHDGAQLLQKYRELGLDLTTADNAVEAGLFEVYQRMVTGRLKVFSTLNGFFREFRIYRRDDKGRVVKQDDHLMDACFVADTLVITETGLVRIADLVGKTGRVLSKWGCWADFYGARMTATNANVIRLTFDDGSSVRCTPDHKFLTPDGWKKACDMKGETCYNAVSQRTQRNKLCSLLRSPIKFKSFLETGIIWLAGISGLAPAASADCFTGASGNFITTGQAYQKVCKSTTSTATARTIIPTTCRPCLPETTSNCTTMGTRGPLPWRLWKAPQNGTAHRKASLGTNNIMPSTVTPCTPPKFGIARIVLRVLMGKSEAASNSAATLAKPKLAWRLASTMKNVFAACAAWLLWQIDTLKSERVPVHAGTKCLEIQNAGKADVYCLTVPGVSTFAVEGGLTVHNCRYLVVSGIDRSCLAPDAGERFAAQRSGRSRSAASDDYDPLKGV